ncbi:hypothetical protein BGX38DRAFT_1271618 [Terfezia claveryi]|nr:hypothetical protein BGX38DRAFT_1271618 [Terfezia claveryi]
MFEEIPVEEMLGFTNEDKVAEEKEVRETKSKVYEQILRYPRIEGKPTEADPDKAILTICFFFNIKSNTREVCDYDRAEYIVAERERDYVYRCDTRFVTNTAPRDIDVLTVERERKFEEVIADVKRMCQQMEQSDHALLFFR